MRCHPIAAATKAPHADDRRAVRIWHVTEIERVRLGEAMNDVQFFDAQQNRYRPNHVRLLHSDRVDLQRHVPRRWLGGKRYFIMTDKNVGASANRYRSHTGDQRKVHRILLQLRRVARKGIGS